MGVIDAEGRIKESRQKGDRVNEWSEERRKESESERYSNVELGIVVKRGKIQPIHDVNESSRHVEYRRYEM